MRSMWGSACQEGASHRRCCDSGMADVTLTVNRGDHVCVSGEPDAQKPASPPHYYHFLMGSVSFFSSLADTSESLILVLRQIESQ